MGTRMKIVATTLTNVMKYFGTPLIAWSWRAQGS